MNESEIRLPEIDFAAIGEIRLGDWLSGGMREHPEVILTDVERQLRRAVCCREEDRTAPVRP